MSGVELSHLFTLVSDETTWAVLAIVFLASLVRATFGFGEALVAMPLLSLVIGVRAATPLVSLLSVVNAVTLLVHEYKNLCWQRSWRLIASSLCGIPVGVLLLTRLPEGPVKILLALIVIGFAGYCLWCPYLLTLATDRTAFLFGFCAGILSGAYNTGGPPLVIYGTMRQWSPEEFRSTLQSIFLPSGLVVLVGHGSAGLWTSTILSYWLAALPFAFLAAMVGLRLSRLLQGRAFVRCVYLLLLLVGALLLFNVWYGA